MSLATNLSHAMAQQGHTNSRLAAVLGVSRQAVQRWRRGIGVPSQEHVAALCNVLGCNVRKSLFATNLADEMVKRRISDKQLAALVRVSRKTVRAWRTDTVTPDKASMDALCVVLQCNLRQYVRPPKMLSISAWARREGIPVARARDLFDLKLLTGEHRTAHTLSVPVSIRAPRDSKSVVTMTKRRPAWVPTFHENFPRLVTDSNRKCSEIATIVGVQSSAVYHWLHARTYPVQERLPLIAEALGVTVEALAGSTACAATQRERL